MQEPTTEALEQELHGKKNIAAPVHITALSLYIPASSSLIPHRMHTCTCQQPMPAPILTLRMHNLTNHLSHRWLCQLPVFSLYKAMDKPTYTTPVLRSAQYFATDQTHARSDVPALAHGKSPSPSLPSLYSNLLPAGQDKYSRLAPTSHGLYHEQLLLEEIHS